MCENFWLDHSRYGARSMRFAWPLCIAAALLVLIFLNVSTALAGTPGFAQPSPFGLGDTMSGAVAAGDMDGDGDLDLITADTGDNGHLLYLNNARAGFAVKRIVGMVPGDASCVAVGDLDGDGDLDVVFGSLNEAAQVYVNDGKGNFTPGVSLGDDGNNYTSVAIGDLDGDGDFDLVFGGMAGEVVVYVNDGSAQFSADASWDEPGNVITRVVLGYFDDNDTLDIVTGVFTGTNAIYFNEDNLSFSDAHFFGPEDPTTKGLAVADFDDNERLDLVVGNFDAPSVLYMNFDGVDFTLTHTFAITSVVSVAAGDLDGDGVVDVAFGREAQFNLAYFNDGEENFAVSRTFGQRSNMTTDITMADLNGDGALDLVVVTAGEQDMVYLNNGAGGSTVGRNVGPGNDPTESIAVADFDGDGLLDLLVGNVGAPTQVYLNDKSNPAKGLALHYATSVAATRAVIVADFDGDGDLDFAAGNVEQPNVIYFNDGAGNFPTTRTFGTLTGQTTALAVGDLDGDGDLDLVEGNQKELNRVYLNSGAGIFSLAYTFGNAEEYTFALALGDLDNDGDLDLVEGNYNGQNLLYDNDGAGHFDDTNAQIFGPDSDWTNSVALGDLDADGNLDIVVGNEGQQNMIYFNLGAGGSDQRPFGPGADWTYDIVVQDLDGDSDLDIVVANRYEQNAVYLNDGLGLFNWSTPASTFGTGEDQTTCVAVGDLDNDGIPDFAAGNAGEQNVIYVNNLRWPQSLINTPPTMGIQHPGRTPVATGYASSEILANIIPITYTLYDWEADPVARIQAYFSLNGGGSWLPAVAAAGTVTTNLSASRWPTGTQHVYLWDAPNSKFYGRSDNVIFRIVAYADVRPRPYSVPGPYQLPYTSAETSPFRVRGNQIRVLQGAQPMAGAQVFHFLAGDLRADPFTNSAGQPYVTDAQGYLQGRGALQLGDRLVAIAPISATQDYTLYYASAAPTLTGLDAHVVTTLGMQTLQVSATHPLLLFNLDVSLEWDARNDGTFLTDLQAAIRRSSEVLYDVSDGQIAIGEVRVHHAKAQWLGADVVMYAQNGIRPRASMGGVTAELRDDVGVSGVITNAYGPGQIRMGPNWDPFGQDLAELSANWQRAFAHELAHYLLYLPDNYIGVSATGLPISTDCQGSFMTSTYDDAYSEFLTRTGWVGQCLDTVAAKLLDRTDWETVRKFYGMLLEPATTNTGPSLLPLNVTQMRQQTPATSAVSFAPAFFDLRKPTGELFAVPRAQGYLFKTGGTSDLTDDSVIALGATVGGGDRIKVRGAAAGDRLCVFGPYNETTQSAAMGCLPSLQAGQQSVPMTMADNWQPVIIVNAVTSETWAITATLKAAVSGLNMQLYPAYGAVTDTQTVLAPWKAMTVKPGNPLLYTAQMTLDDPSFEGIVRVWVPGQEGQREALTQFFLSPPWGPNSGGSGLNADMRAWGANSRQLGAPVASGDGQVTIFNTDNFFAEAGTTSLQALTELPNFPLWLTPVGKGYRFVSSVDTPRALMFNYHQRDVPEGYEHTIHIYFQPEGSSAWQRLSTALDTSHNQATTQMLGNGEGIYALASTLDVPLTGAGWNLFGYLNLPRRTVTEALVSITGYYSQVATYDPAAAAQWRIYDVAVMTEHPQYAGLVNDLTYLESPFGYWLYATENITLFLKVPAPGELIPYATLTPGLPPATFYGPVRATATFTPAAGMPVTATVNGVVCGRGVVVEWAGGPAYRIMVASDTGDNCGVSGRGVQFAVGGYVYPQMAEWQNFRAWYLPLEVSTLQYVLEIARTGNGNGIVTPTVGLHTYNEGTVVALAATAAPDSTFDGWSGDADCADGSVTMTASKACTATFTLKTYVITPTWGTGGSITPGAPQTVTHGDDITFTVAADEGYYIVDVYVDGKPLDPEQTFIFQTSVFTYTFQNVSANHTIHAEFAAMPPAQYFIYLPAVLRASAPAQSLNQLRGR